MITLLLLLLVRPPRSYAEINRAELSFRASNERIKMPGGERMGLLGTSVLVDRKIHERFALYSGLGIYSAVSGDRGGFFTGGLDIGASLQIEKWRFGAGLFVGGGGGASAPQGGGLMLRPHLSILWDFQVLRAGLFFSQVKFPNGGIDGKQVGLQIERPFQVLTADTIGSDIADDDLELQARYIAPALQRYHPTSGARIRGGGALAEKMTLAGVEAGGFIGDRWMVFVEAAGALEGESDGYAELLGGLGLRLRLGERFSILAKVAMGSGGGGNVDTAGGLLYKLSGGVSIHPSPRVTFDLHYGRVAAPEGGFEAELFKASLAYRIDLVSPSSHNNRLSPENLKLGRWTIRPTVMRYLSSNRLRKGGGNNEAVDLFILKLDRALNTHLYVSGQAGAAFRGNAGGYATGLFGIGLKRALSKQISLLAEALAGAGGGGGIASDGGGIAQGIVGGGYRLSDHWGLQFFIGKVIGLRGDLDAVVIEGGLAYRFNTIESRPLKP